MFSLRGALDAFCDQQTPRPEHNSPVAGTAPLPLNLYDANDELHVEAFLPGVGREDVRLEIDRGVLTIAAARQGVGRGDWRWYLSEFGGGAFARSLRLPYPVDQERATAHLADGVLRLTLPKAASAKPRRIAIGGSQQAQSASGHTGS
jgi:HSP20 family protein